LVVPTSTIRVPDCAITSGTRKSPPISTSSPRETMVSPPRASAVRTSSAPAAQLLTTSASSAPVSSATARARREIVFERAVARGFLGDGAARRFRERRAPQVRVQDDARRVDDAAQARRRVAPDGSRQASERLRQQRLARLIPVRARAQLCAQLVRDGARQPRQPRVARAGAQGRVRRGGAQQRVDRRQRTH
jgi:hypothetical protein